MKFVYRKHEIHIWEEGGKSHYQIRGRDNAVVETGPWAPNGESIVTDVKEIVDQLLLPGDAR